jgi:RecG-like helicase
MYKKIILFFVLYFIIVTSFANYNLNDKIKKDIEIKTIDYIIKYTKNLSEINKFNKLVYYINKLKSLKKKYFKNSKYLAILNYTENLLKNEIKLLDFPLSVEQKNILREI